MAKDNILSNKVFLIISLILLVVIVGSIFYFTQRNNYPADAVAVIQYHGAQFTVNASTLQNIEQIAAQQNITLNRTLAIERLVQLAVLNEQAHYLNITPTQDQVDAAVAQQLKTLDAQGLEQALVAQNMTRAAFEANLRASVIQDLTLQLLFQKEVVSKLQISDDQLAAAYKANPDQFKVPETVSVKHILICYAGAPSCMLNITKEQAQQNIIAMYQALTTNGSNITFEQLAAQYSTDKASGQRGGDIGAISKDQTVAQFETVAFETPVGSISKPFESPYGYHIVAVYAKQAAQMLSLEQVAPQLKQQMILQQANTLQQVYINGLMANAQVTVVG